MHNLQGIGISYRQEFQNEVLELKRFIDFLEISPEYFYNVNNFDELESLKEHFKLIPHSQSLSLGSFEDLNMGKVKKLKDLTNMINAPFITDHMAFNKVADYELFDFLPVIFNDDTLKLLKEKISKLKKQIGVPIYLENITYQFNWPNNSYNELVFWKKVLSELDVGMLLDVSNLYVNSYNHNYDPYKFFDMLPKEKINHLHIAGYIEQNGILIDSHSTSISEEVWSLYEYILNNAPIQTVNLERDVNINSIEDVSSDLIKLKSMYRLVQT